MKKIFLFVLIFLITNSVWAVDTKLEDLTAGTPSTDDEMYFVDNPGVSSADRSTTVANLNSALSASALSDTADIVFESELTGDNYSPSGDWTFGDLTVTGTIIADGNVLRSPATKTVCSSTTDIADDSCDYICDGTDDDVQIQAAIDALVAGAATGSVQAGAGGKGTVEITEGTYTIGSPIKLEPGISIRGQGMTSTVLVAKNSFNDNIMEFDEATEDPSAGVLIEGIYFSGNSANNTSGTAIDTQVGAVALWDLHIIRCFFYDFDSTAIKIDDPWGFRMFQSHIEDSFDYAIEIDVGASKTEGAILSDNKIIQNTKGVRLDNVDGVQFVDNEINTTGVGNYAIELVAADNTIIANNKFWGGTNGIDVNSPSILTNIIGNTFAGLSGDAVTVDSGATAAQILDNTFNFITGSEIIDNGTTTHICLNEGNDDATDDCSMNGSLSIGQILTVGDGTGTGQINFVGSIAGDSSTGSMTLNDTLDAVLFQALDADLTGGFAIQLNDSAGTAEFAVYDNAGSNKGFVVDTAGNMAIRTQATAPATCAIGDFYVDTSGAACACTATNTWSNMTATGTCS